MERKKDRNLEEQTAYFYKLMKQKIIIFSFEEMIYMAAKILLPY